MLWQQQLAPAIFNGRALRFVVYIKNSCCCNRRRGLGHFGAFAVALRAQGALPVVRAQAFRVPEGVKGLLQVARRRAHAAHYARVARGARQGLFQDLGQAALPERGVASP